MPKISGMSCRPVSAWINYYALLLQWIVANESLRQLRSAAIAEPVTLSVRIIKMNSLIFIAITFLQLV
ncbi:hypothetical protein SAMN05216379_102115 [Nitrosomonas eutropha]|nr:hypothetical protein SAMN05216379_102115 [Nitrosomonas eutropha]